MHLESHQNPVPLPSVSRMTENPYLEDTNTESYVAKSRHLLPCIFSLAFVIIFWGGQKRILIIVWTFLFPCPPPRFPQSPFFLDFLTGFIYWCHCCINVVGRCWRWGRCVSVWGSCEILTWVLVATTGTVTCPSTEGFAKAPHTVDIALNCPGSQVWQNTIILTYVYTVGIIIPLGQFFHCILYFKFKQEVNWTLLLKIKL